MKVRVPRYATREDAYVNMKDEFLRCREVGHEDEIEEGWGVTVIEEREVKAPGRRRKEKQFVRVTYTGWRHVRRRCRSCGRQLVRWFNQISDPLTEQPRSTYPDGYLLEGLGRGLPRQEARRERARRDQPMHEELVEEIIEEEA